MSRVQLVRRLGIEASIWLCFPAAFLFTYLHVFSVSSRAVAPHLHLVGVGLLALLLIRMALFRLIPRKALSQLTAAAITSALLFVIFFYYALVIVGLQSWGRVISWELIASYSAQAPELLDALGISLPIAVGVLGLIYAGLFLATRMYLRHFDWIPFFAQGTSNWLIALIVLSGGAVFGIELYKFIAGPWIEESEPVSLTFFAKLASRDLQQHAIDPLIAAKRDRMDDLQRSSYRPASDADRKNLILIVVDALRPDHMGVYGYHRDTTPNLSRLANTAKLRKITNIHATCAESACGLLSLASSKFVHQFSNRPFTLQEVLKRHGYRIHMILGGDHTNFYGLRELYGEVDSYFDGASSLSRDIYMNDDRFVLDRLAGLSVWDGVPVMIQFHLMSTHAVGKRHVEAARFSPAASYVRLIGRDLGPDQHPEDRFVNFYDNGVVEADATIRGILDILDRKGYFRDSLVIITSDHGESLGEHGFYGHTTSVREEQLRVPLLMISYGYQPEKLAGEGVLASQVDIAPTVLREFRMPRPETWSGLPLQEPMSGEFTYFQEKAEVGLFDHRDTQVVWKYWMDTRAGKEYVFNLSTDPGETRNAINEVPAALMRKWRLQSLAGAANVSTH
jgi:glucan phosphoethanolaminetransferase (alkaline phosphatase superfamily)